MGQAEPLQAARPGRDLKAPTHAGMYSSKVEAITSAFSAGPASADRSVDRASEGSIGLAVFDQASGHAGWAAVGWSCQSPDELAVDGSSISVDSSHEGLLDAACSEYALPGDATVVRRAAPA